MNKRIMRLVVALLISFLLTSLHPPSSALAVDPNLAAPENLKVTIIDRTLNLSWKYPKDTNPKIKGFQISISAKGWKNSRTLDTKSRSLKITTPRKAAEYKIRLTAITEKTTSLALNSIFNTKSNKQLNVIKFLPLSNMFMDSPGNWLQVTSSSGEFEVTSQTPAVCVVENLRVEPRSVGECILNATSGASRFFEAAKEITRTFLIADRPQGFQRTLIWEEEFEGRAGTSPNNESWTADVSDGCQDPYNNCGWGNNERQWYAKSSNTVDGSNMGVLNISAKKLTGATSLYCYYGPCEWRSGKITTYNKVGFTYGYLEARIKAPVGSGTWPAFWLLNTTIRSNPWPFSGEIDIWEYKGAFPKLTYSTVHYADNQGDHQYIGGVKDALVKLSNDFHVYGMHWQENEINFYIDDIFVHKVAKSDTGLNYWPFGKNAQGQDPVFYAVLNLAMGGNFGGPVDTKLTSAELKVDWVRYYSVNGQGRITK